MEEEKLHLLQVRECDETPGIAAQEKGIEEVMSSRLLLECFGRVLTSFIVYLFAKYSWIALKEENKLFGKIMIWSIILLSMLYQILVICQGAFLELELTSGR